MKRVGDIETHALLRRLRITYGHDSVYRLMSILHSLRVSDQWIGRDNLDTYLRNMENSAIKRSSGFRKLWLLSQQKFVDLVGEVENPLLSYLLGKVVCLLHSMRR